MHAMTRAAFALAAIALPFVQPAAVAQSAAAFPTKPVHIVIQTGSGGSVDLVARLLAQKLAAAWKEQVIVDNRPGAGGMVSADAVAKSPPDGHTLYFTTESPMVVLPYLFAKLPYNPATDFTPISLLVRMQYVLAIHPSLPANTLPELIAHLRERPGKVNYGSPGNGVPHHLGMEWLKTAAKVDVVHIPFKTNALATTDLLTGRVSMMFNTLGSVGSHINAGKLRPIAVAGATRIPQLPNVPTVAESGGFPGFEFLTWVGLVGPAGVPRDIVNRIYTDSVAAIQSPDIKERFDGLAFEAASGTPAEFAALIKSEATKWAYMVKISGARVD